MRNSVKLSGLAVLVAHLLACWVPPEPPPEPPGTPLLTAERPVAWSFHPGGVVKEVLGGLEAGTALSLAPFLVASLDPCVACRVAAEEGAPRSD